MRKIIKIKQMYPDSILSALLNKQKKEENTKNLICFAHRILNSTDKHFHSVPRELSLKWKLLIEMHRVAARECNKLKQRKFHFGVVVLFRILFLSSYLLSDISFGVIDERNFETDENMNHPSSSFSDGIM